MPDEDPCDADRYLSNLSFRGTTIPSNDHADVNLDDGSLTEDWYKTAGLDIVTGPPVPGRLSFNPAWMDGN